MEVPIVLFKPTEIIFSDEFKIVLYHHVNIGLKEEAESINEQQRGVADFNDFELETIRWFNKE